MTQETSQLLFLELWGLEKGSSSDITLAQVTEVPVILYSRQHAVMSVLGSISGAMRGRWDGIAEQDREYIIVRGVRLGFIEG